MPKRPRTYQLAAATQRKPRPDRRASSSARGYDAAWQKVRRAFLAEHPLCERCTAASRTAAATQVHHRQTIADRPDLRLNWSNLEALCEPCHIEHHRDKS
jgi:5-methylcytosine-specific restriction protein A